MKIWWCDYHYSGNGRPTFCDFGWFTQDREVCRMVEMELTPVQPLAPEMTEPLFTNTHGTW